MIDLVKRLAELDAKKVKESTVTELSKGTLKSFAKERGATVHADQRDSQDAHRMSADAGAHGDSKKAAAWDDEASWLHKRAEKGAAGVAKATIKIAKKTDEAGRDPDTTPSEWDDEPRDKDDIPVDESFDSRRSEREIYPSHQPRDHAYENKGTIMKSTDDLALESIRLLSGIKAKLAENGIPSVDTPLTHPTSLTASANSGPELTAFLKDIMNLAGVKPVTQNDMPEIPSAKSPVPGADASAEPDMKSLMAIVGDDEPEGELDSMNDIDVIDSEPEDEGVIGTALGGMAGGTAGEIGGAALGGMAGGPVGAAIGGVAGDVAGTALGGMAGNAMTSKDEKPTDEEVEEDEDWHVESDITMPKKIHINHTNRPFDNSPNEKMGMDGVQKFGDTNNGGSGDRMDGNMPKAKVSDAMAESLFAAYKKFVAEEKSDYRQNYKPEAEKKGIGSKIAGVAKKVGKAITGPGDDELLDKLAKDSGGKRK